MKKLNLIRFLLFPVVLCIAAGSCTNEKDGQITGEKKAWHTVTLTFTGPNTSEYDTVNPFTDYRLDVEFSNGNQKIIVPGYFAADGNAAETSARSGNKWRAHFCPPSPGTWNYNVAFLKGKNSFPGML